MKTPMGLLHKTITKNPNRMDTRDTNANKQLGLLLSVHGLISVTDHQQKMSALTQHDSHASRVSLVSSHTVGPLPTGFRWESVRRVRLDIYILNSGDSPAQDGPHLPR